MGAAGEVAKGGPDVLDRLPLLGCSPPDLMLLVDPPPQTPQQSVALDLPERTREWARGLANRK